MTTPLLNRPLIAASSPPTPQAMPAARRQAMAGSAVVAHPAAGPSSRRAYGIVHTPLVVDVPFVTATVMLLLAAVKV